MTFDGVVRGLLGIVLVLAVGFVFSTNRRRIPWRLVAIGIGLQFGFALLVLKTSAGRWVFQELSRFFVFVFGFAADGARFVFGPLANAPGAQGSLGFFFAFQVLPTIIFFAALMGILYHAGLMQRVVQGMAWIMLRVLGTSGAESLNVAANTFIGQTEAPLVIRPYLKTLTESELFTVLTSGMAHIAGGVLAAYVQMLGTAAAAAAGTAAEAEQVRFAGHFLAACIMAAPATMVVAKMLVPETGEPQTMGSVKLSIEKTHVNMIDAAASGAADGVRLAINVGGMLVAFIAVIALANALLGWVGDAAGWNTALRAAYGGPLSLELLFGFVFQFIAYTIGVPWHDAMNVGSLLGIKLVLNEFVAYSRMAELVGAGALGDKSIVIATYALCGFANFSSMAIQLGGIGPLAENRRADIARLGLRSVLGGSIATWMMAAIAGMLV
ncbi:MAG: NupC/NupG family nucleoside CNT transporter [Ignavibacteriae bacterium]|nr:NupC/NupG family nucleoside CNT transporter [Ignavibacteriota bacterium]